MYMPRYKRVLELLAIARRNPLTRRLPNGEAISTEQLRRSFVDLEHAAFNARKANFLRVFPKPAHYYPD